MWGNRYFGRYWGDRYFANGASTGGSGSGGSLLDWVIIKKKKKT